MGACCDAGGCRWYGWVRRLAGPCATSRMRTALQPGPLGLLTCSALTCSPLLHPPFLPPLACRRSRRAATSCTRTALRPAPARVFTPALPALPPTAPSTQESPCGHFMHSHCFAAYTRYSYTCPVCFKSLGDMSVYWKMIDSLLAAGESWLRAVVHLPCCLAAAASACTRGCACVHAARWLPAGRWWGSERHSWGLQGPQPGSLLIRAACHAGRAHDLDPGIRNLCALHQTAPHPLACSTRASWRPPCASRALQPTLCPLACHPLQSGCLQSTSAGGRRCCATTAGRQATLPSTLCELPLLDAPVWVCDCFGPGAFNPACNAGAAAGCNAGAGLVVTRAWAPLRPPARRLQVPQVPVLRLLQHARGLIWRHRTAPCRAERPFCPRAARPLILPAFRSLFVPLCVALRSGPRAHPVFNLKPCCRLPATPLIRHVYA